MRVLYEASVLGMGFSQKEARTGVHRFVERVAAGLRASGRCELRFCVTTGLDRWNSVLDLVGSQGPLHGVPVEKPVSRAWPARRALHLAQQTLGFPAAGGWIRSSLERISQPDLLHWRDAQAADVFHATLFPIPAAARGGPQPQRFQTLHDLIPILYPQFFQLAREHFLHQVMRNLEPEDWVICNSESTRRDFCGYKTQFDPKRVFVTPLAASELFFPCRDPNQIAAVLRRYRIPPGRPYLLALGTLEPRKNLDHAVRCFARLARERGQEDLMLVLVGNLGWDYGRIFGELDALGEGIRQRVVVTGFVEDEDLAPLYSGALAFVFPSLYEGFGLPLLEAMQCGIPVISSNTSSMPEVVGQAGILVDPSDGDSLCQAVLDVRGSTELRERLARQSRERAREFSWARCVDLTLAAYRTALDL